MNPYWCTLLAFISAGMDPVTFQSFFLLRYYFAGIDHACTLFEYRRIKGLSTGND